MILNFHINIVVIDGVQLYFKFIRFKMGCTNQRVWGNIVSCKRFSKEFNLNFQKQKYPRKRRSFLHHELSRPSNSRGYPSYMGLGRTQSRRNSSKNREVSPLQLIEPSFLSCPACKITTLSTTLFLTRMYEIIRKTYEIWIICSYNQLFCDVISNVKVLY